MMLFTKLSLFINGTFCCISFYSVPEDPVVIEEGTFSWTKEEDPTLVNLNFRVKEGSLVAVVGQVGAGKSSLLSALLGEMVKWSGRVNVKVRIKAIL